MIFQAKIFLLNWAPAESLGLALADERRQQDQGARAAQQRARRHRDRRARRTPGGDHREGGDRRQAGTQFDRKKFSFRVSPKNGFKFNFDSLTLNYKISRVAMVNLTGYQVQ